MRCINLKKAIMSLALGLTVVFGISTAADAQTPVHEQREWQRAEQRAQREHQQYLRTRSSRDYRDWQIAAQRAQQERAEYQRSLSFANRRGYNTGYTNNNRRTMYRVYRDGRYYNVDDRGVELLRSAVNHGYNQGYRQGQIARQTGRSYAYQNESMYRSGTYGYQSYVDRNQYQHYFQQGFQRGFEDGYNSTSRYGSRSGNTANILSGVLNTILNIATQ